MGKGTRFAKSLLQPAVVGGAIVCLLFLEKKRPLRSSVESKVPHDLRNFAIAGLSALTIRLTEKPLTDRLTEQAVKHKFGLLPKLNLPRWLSAFTGVLLLDYTLYLWHVLTHKSKFLWRFHEVHHQDVDLTATTALRFHFGEMALSAFWRSTQVLVLGISAKTLKLWQTLTLLEILFHHSNVRLPMQVEKWLSRVVVTPRLHGIHHSIVQDETDSNWSSGFIIWDWLHGTLRYDVPQDQIQIGVPAYGDEEDRKFFQLVQKPFKKQRNSWHPTQSPGVRRSRTLVPGHLVLSRHQMLKTLKKRSLI